MWKATCIVLGVLFWLGGFFRQGFTDMEGPPFVNILIRPPFWVYVLCGLPRASNLPKGVLSTGVVLIQFLGILWIAYGIIFGSRLSTLHIFVHALIITIFSICILLFCWLLSKRYPYSTAKEEIE